MENQEVIKQQDISVWEIESEGEEESEEKVNWTIVYAIKDDIITLIRVIDQDENEIDYEAQGYTDKDLIQMLESTEQGSEKESIVKRVRDHHRTIVERGDLSLANRVVARYLLKEAQKTVTWEKDQFLEIPEAEATGILPYQEWLDFLYEFSLNPSAENFKILFENFDARKYWPKGKFLSQPLR